MRETPIETLVKKRLYEAVVAEVIARGLNRHDLSRLTGEPWSRQTIYRFLEGPEHHPCSASRLQRIAGCLGLEAEVEVRVRPAGRKQLPIRHAVPLAA